MVRISETYEVDVEDTTVKDLLNDLELEEEEAEFTLQILDNLSNLDSPELDEAMFVGSSVTEAESEYGEESDVDLVYNVSRDTDMLDVGVQVRDYLQELDMVKKVDQEYHTGGGVGFFKPLYKIHFTSDRLENDREYELNFRGET